MSKSTIITKTRMIENSSSFKTQMNLIKEIQLKQAAKLKLQTSK